MGSLSKQDFIEQFVVQFLASYTATIYEDCCMRGQHAKLRKPPVEDAIHLAEEAWNELVDKDSKCKVIHPTYSEPDNG